jgi:hypothetical protein
VDEDVPAPDPVDALVLERHRLDARLYDLDLESAGRFARALDVHGNRVEREAAKPVFPDEPDGVFCVARADVQHDLSPLRAERGEEREQPVAAVRIEASAERLLEFRVCLAGPELVQLVD